MAAETQKQLIALLVAGQEKIIHNTKTHYQVWNANGIATARIKQNSAEIVAAIKGVAPQIIREEDKDDETEEQKREREEKERKEQEEEDRRNRGEGGLFSGIMGVLKTLAVGKDGKGEKSLFGKGGIWGIVKSMFGILWKLIKFIGGPLLLIGGLAFMFMDAKKQEELIKSVTDALTGAWEFIKDMGEAFKGGFITGWNKEGGLKDSLNDFTKAWGGVFDTIAKTEFGGKKGLTGVASWLGEAVADFATGLVNFGTLIAELITNPTETMAKIQVKIEGFFMGIVDSLGQMFDRFFNMENLLKILESMGVPIPDQMMLTAAGKRIREKQEEIKDLEKNDENMRKLRDSAKIDLAKEQALGEKADSTKLRNLQLTITSAEEQIKRNEDIREYNQEVIGESAKTAAQELKNQKIKRATGIDLQDKKEEIDELKKDAEELLGKEIVGRERGAQTDWGSAGADVEGTVASFQLLRKKMAQDFGMEIEKGQVTNERGQYRDVVKGGVTAEYIESDEGQRLIREMAKSGLLEDRGTKFGQSKSGDDSFYNAAEKINAFLLRGIKAQDQIEILNQKQKDITDAVDKKVKGIEDELETQAISETALKYDIDPALLKNLKEYNQGGVVDYTGLAWVHGGKGKGEKEVMYDNIQVNRMEALLTMGERDRGGGGSNDFSTQNMDNRRITSTVTNVAAPQRHLFGVQEQRFGIA